MIDKFLEYLLSVKGKSKKTVDEYKLDLNIFYDFLKDRLNDKEINIEELNKINLIDLHAFIGYLSKERKNCNKTKARKIACVKSYFKYLQQMKLIQDNPTIDLESPKIEKRLPVYLSLEESKKLLESAKENKRDFTILTLFLNCGLRLSELISIDIDNIKSDTLTVIGKGNKERIIYLNDACLEAINDYLTHRNCDNEALFISNRKIRFTQKGIQHMLEKYLSRIGLSDKKYSPHKLRHTAATLMYQNGVDILTLKEILGHESVSTTQIYTHVNNNQLRNAVKINPLNI